MAGLRLARLPDRSPVKIAISIAPELNCALTQYAALYREAYGAEEPVHELIPAMLSAFLEGDRAFQRWRRTAPAAGGEGGEG